jgi:hypothetical protein
MVGDLPEGRPRRARCDVLAAAAAATRMRADIGNGEIGAKLRDEQIDRKDRVMPATVAPAENIYRLAFEFAKRGRTAIPLFVREASLFHSAHVGFVAPAGPYRFFDA